MDIKMLEKAKPILMSTPMVQASMRDIDPKTQTRRVLKPQPTFSENSGYNWNGGAYGIGSTDEGTLYNFVRPLIEFHSRYKPGDVLWVRETFYQYGEWHIKEITDKNGERIEKHTFIPCGIDKPIYYFDTLPPETEIKQGYKSGRGYYKRPSIFMPREAARLFLRVTGVRAERLQDISVVDAKDEGIRVHANGCIDGLAFGCYNGDDCVNNVCNRPIELYQELWDSLNAKRDGGIYEWVSNPWVWVYTFKRIAGQ